MIILQMRLFKYLGKVVLRIVIAESVYISIEILYITIFYVGKIYIV